MQKTLGQVGYDAYGEAAAWLTYDGRPMPSWDVLGTTEVGRETQRRWACAAGAISADIHIANATPKD